MSIPLDHLYSFIHNMAEQIRGDVVDLHYFYPHGSKDINHLNSIKTILGYQRHTSPMIFCNDQEPLDFERYQDIDRTWISDKIKIAYKKYNLKKYNFQATRYNIYDKSLLIHSEQRSVNLEKYRNNWFIPVYYWSHAVISLDWFRYAEHVTQRKNVKKPFLIYSRAWSGTREYRLKFAELLIQLGLQDSCQTSVNPVEPELGIHYELHEFKNPIWRPQTVLENFFPLNNAHSHYSADFDIEDYEATDIEVVLETLFDDDRLQLTEKSLRPIACGQPFILAGTHGSLEYLRKYGFKTFDHIWDERYDLIEDPLERLIAIADVMRHIANWTPEQRANKIAEAQVIADYNRQLFFSQEFFDRVISELDNNLIAGLEELENTNTSRLLIEQRKITCKIPEFKERWYYAGPDSYWPGRTRQDMLRYLARARYYYNRSLGSTNI
jgi:hypothetical protein